MSKSPTTHHADFTVLCNVKVYNNVALSTPKKCLQF